MVQESVPANDRVIAFFDRHHEFPPLLMENVPWRSTVVALEGPL